MRDDDRLPLFRVGTWALNPARIRRIELMVTLPPSRAGEPEVRECCRLWLMDESLPLVLRPPLSVSFRRYIESHTLSVEDLDLGFDP